MTRGDLALNLLGLWFVVGFVVRVALHVARTGSPGIKGLPRGAGLREVVAGALFMSAIVAAPISALGFHSGVIPPLVQPLHPWSAVLGTALMLSGILGTAFAQRAMGRSWRIGVDPAERTELVTTGIFAVVRNPIYTAMVIGVAGLAWLVPSLASIGTFGLLLCALELQVRVVEEPYLRALHGQAYAAYESKVGRFLPRVGARRGEPPATG